MERLDNFRAYISEMEKRKDYSKSKRLNMLLQEINDNFGIMSNGFSRDIILELSKNMKNAESAQRILVCLFNINYTNKNRDNTEMSEISQANRVIEEAVYQLLQKYQDREGKNSEKRTKLLLDCYSKIAGKIGTTNKVINEMSIEDIEDITIGKLSKEGINSNELIDILYKKAPTIIDAEEKKKFIKLVENTAIGYIKKNPEKLENPNVFKIFEMLIQSYRNDVKSKTLESSSKKKENANETYTKIGEILNMADKFLESVKEKYGEQSYKYRNLCEENFLLKRQAYGYRTMSMQDLEKLLIEIEMELIHKIDTAESHISEGANERNSEERGEGNGERKTANVMSVSDKLAKISEAVLQLKQKYPDKDISFGEVYAEENNVAFNGYYIIQIKGANCYLLEKFNNEENSALYVVASKDINSVFKLIKDQRNVVKSHPLVISVNHKDTQGASSDKSFASRVRKAIEEVTMEHDKLAEMWEEAFILDKEIAKHRGADGRDSKIKAIEKQHRELTILSELERSYDEKLAEINRQESIVGKIDEKRKEKAKKYSKKIGQNYEEK